MRVLLTGSNSFSGKVVARELREQGHHLTTISRSSSDATVIGDIASIDSLPAHYDVLVHIAATSPADGIDNDQLVHDNILATQNLIKLARKSNISKCIFFSTLSVYGNVNDSILTEATPIHNPCAYGASKLMCESLLRAQDNFSTIAIRLPAVIGAGAARHWLANVILKLQRDADVVIFNPVAIFNNAIHIDILSKFVVDLVSTDLKKKFDYVNVASSGGLSIATIIEVLRSSLGSNSKIIIGDGGKKPFSISTEYASNTYGFYPENFAESLQKYIQAVLIKSPLSFTNL